MRSFLAGMIFFCIISALPAQEAMPNALIHQEPYRTTLSYAEWLDRAWIHGYREPLDPVPDIDAIRSYYTPSRYEALNGEADVRVDRIVYLSDGLRIKGVAIRPKLALHPLPVIVWCRGGIASIGTITAGDLIQMTNWARRGYLVLATNYRGSPGSEGKDEDGGADLHDVLALIELGKKLPDADSTRTYLYGQSRGGMMVYQALAAGAQVRAAAVNSGVADFYDKDHPRPDQEEMEELAREAIPRYDVEKAGGFFSRSAVRWPEKIHAPVLLLHGTKDWRVDPTQALRMATALQKAGRPYELRIFEGGSHVVLNGKQSEIDDLILSYFARY